MEIKTYFFNIKNIIIDELRSSNKSIKIALAYFTDNEIFDVLCEQANKGKEIELILSNDDLNFKKGSLNFLKLVQIGGKCFFHQNDNSLMHHKFSIIDNKIVITGSYNWTIKAQQNNENIVIIQNQEVVNKFQDEFCQLKKNCSEKLNLISNLCFISEIVNLRNTFERTIFPTFFTDLDVIISGLVCGELVLIAGRRTMGTTSLILNFIVNILKKQTIPIGIFSLDSSASNIVISLMKILTKSEITTENAIKAIERINSVDNWLADQPILIDDTASLTIEDLNFKIIQMVENHNVKIVFIDHLDYLRISNKENYNLNKFQIEIDNELIIKELRIIARQLNISIVLTHILGKSLEMRSGDKKPRLSDLSGNLDNYADKVIFIHRPEKYGITQDPDGNSLVNIAELQVLLNSSGNTGDVKLYFDDKNQLFSTLEDNFNNKPLENSKIFEDENYGTPF